MFLYNKIKPYFTREDQDVAPLESLDLKGVAKLIKDGKAKSIVTMAGAGLSTSCGIPDFRSPNSGVYDNLHQFNLPHPTAVFEIGFFDANPDPFFEVARSMYRPYAKPSLGHYFIYLLHRKNVLRMHFTQNVDGLERLAGLPESKLVEAHGSFNTGHCRKCKELHDFNYMKDEIMARRRPLCKKPGCKGIVKPDIVLFNEALSERFYSASDSEIPTCDLLIVMGSSLTVQPFSSLVNLTGEFVPRMFINREQLNIPDNAVAKRDVHVRADVDETVLRLADLLGWKEELIKLKETNDAALDAKMKK